MEKELQDWIVGYLKNRNLIFRDIMDIKEEMALVKVKYKTKDAVFLIKEQLDSSVFKQISKEGHFVIVTASTEANTGFLLKNWKALSEYERLTLYFIDLAANKKVIIMPHTHNKVCDAASLETGIRAMFDSSKEG